MSSVADKASQAKNASFLLAALPRDVKDRALAAVAQALRSRRSEIEAANAADMRRAEEAGVAAPLVKRLTFSGSKVEQSAVGVQSVAALEDPTGRTLAARELDAGLELYQVTVPLGVVGMVFESRPDALVQISSLCLKSGNAVLLKGGAEAAETNRVLFEIIVDATGDAGIPDGWIALLESREDVRAMLALSGSIDLIIPRGSNEFVRFIMDNTSIPVLGHADGVCHVYVDRSADLQQAVAIAADSKTQYVAVCNAAETLLVHADVAQAFLPQLSAAMPQVILRGCERTRAIVPRAQSAAESDWSAEYLDLVLAVRVVDSFDAAVAHINRYGSHHTDAIVTAQRQDAQRFMAVVDSANVMWNCSTRFSDGFRYGLGAEVGISTAKIHSRGPVGLEGLVIYQWRLFGSGQVVADYTGPHARGFSHRPLR
ncbi:MAG: glutamate-5-semialdehyde dehydrogenase [Spirochaetaceae bacterium]|nr:MAG: glutamate-5-semialdehyde dehydrogenase [Spirochaetaceae bacterium]